MHEQKFQKALGGLINMEIGFLLSDNQFIKGILLDVKQDHIVVEVNQNVFYFAHQHIQVLSKNAKDFHISSKIVHYIDKNYLADVLKALKYNWVSINSLGDQALFGVLSRISEDHVTVINNSEILYIPKSYISNISEHQNIIIKKQEQLEIQDCQIEEQITSDHTQKTKEIERITAVEVPTLEISAGEVTEDENSSSEQPVVDSKTRVEIYAALVKVLKHNLLNRNIKNERREDIIQETAIQGFIVHTDESKGQSESSSVVMQDCRVEEQVVIEHAQTINETKSIKSLEDSPKEDSDEEEIGLENVTKDNPEVSLQSVKHDLLNKINEDSLEEDHPGVVESSNQVSLEEQFISTQSRVKRKKKRLLLSAWSTVNNDQYTIANHKSYAKENESLDFGGDSVEREQPSEPIHSLIQPLHDQYPKEDFVTVEKKSDSAETTTFQLPTTHINPKVEKEMLKKQYYALMKQAETNCYHMAERHINLTEEGQYLALMKHAAKRYREFKD